MSPTAINADIDLPQLFWAFLSCYKGHTTNRSNSAVTAHTSFSGLDLDLGMHSSTLSRQDTLPADDPSWSYSQVPGQPAPIPPRNEPLLYIPSTVSNSAAPLQAHTGFSGLDLDLGMHSSALSRQDTLPADDPSLSYSRVPGQPAPIPPHNEPLLYIPSIVHATLSCSKNSELVRLSPPPPFKSVLNDIKPNEKTDLSTNADKTLIACAPDITNPEHNSAKFVMNSQVCILIDTILFYTSF